MGALALLFIDCNHDKHSVNRHHHQPPPVTPPAKNEVDFWLTNGDETVKLQKQTTILAFGTQANQYPTIEVDENTTFQTVDGFGYTLTGGSAEVINSLAFFSKSRNCCRNSLVPRDNSISVSYLRISIGASDLNQSPFTYDDMPAGQTDVNLTNFSLAPDMTNVIPLLKEILAINPNIKILGFALVSAGMDERQ